MSNKTRKRIWPVSLAAAIGVVAMVAVLAATVWTTGTAQAQAPFLGPGNVTATAVSATQVNLTWTAGVGQNSYKVERKTGSGAYSIAAENLTATSYSDTGLTASTTYTYKVSGVNTFGSTVGSPAEVSAMTMASGGTGGTGGTGGMTGVVSDGSPCDDFDTAATDDMAAMAATSCVTSSSTSASATVELKLVIESLDPPGDDETLAVGGSIVIYLEDDFAEPDSISAGDVYFVVSDPVDVTTGNGGRVRSTVDPVIATSDYFDPDKDDISIQVFVPDMCPNATDNCEGDDGLNMGDTVSVVITKGAGIKNPSEEGGHSTGFAVLPATHTGSVPSSPDMTTNTLATYAKIALSDVDNSRGYELTVTGSGFNNGTTAGVYVLAGQDAVWDALNCEYMVMAVGDTRTADEDNPYCAMYDDLGEDEQADVDDLDFTTGPVEGAVCEGIIEHGTNVGAALVGSDDKVSVTFEVTVPTFSRGTDNYICMIDGEGRISATDVEDFHLEPSIEVVPGTVSTGDTVNVFARDYPNDGGSYDGGSLELAGRNTTPSGADLDDFIDDEETIRDGSGSVTFTVPGGYEGVLRIDASWGGVNENTMITIGGAELLPSKTDVLPNETITITGNGMGVRTCIPVTNITLDNVPLIVHDDSTAARCTDDDGIKGVEVSNSGQFVATIILWTPGRDPENIPALIPGTHRLRVEDTANFESDINLTIAEPSITVTPDIAGPRDYITITGENWAVDNLDNSLSDPIDVVVTDFGNGRSYPVYADSVGRFSVEHRVHRKVAIPDTVQVKANYDEGKVVKIGSFAVPASTVTVTPGEGQPGDMVTLTASNMPVYTEADYVEIGGTTYDNPGINTDRDGNITVEDVLIPGLDPGIYSVVINVQNTIAIGEVSVLAESSARGAPAELPGAVESLGNNLVAIFHFDDVGKEWSFYDPRPEFADLNTLTEMVNGEAYWVLVSETVDDVVLNNKARSLTCRGADCWNLEVW